MYEGRYHCEMFDDESKMVIVDLSEISEGKYEVMVMYKDGTEVRSFRSIDFKLAEETFYDWVYTYHWEKPAKITGKYLKLKSDLETAKAIGRSAEDEYMAKHNYDDGGTCNFDAPYVLIPRANKRVMKELGAFEWYESRFVMPVDTRCQGYGRTKNAEAMCEHLKSIGYECGMHYHMD